MAPGRKRKLPAKGDRPRTCRTHRSTVGLISRVRCWSIETLQSAERLLLGATNEHESLLEQDLPLLGL